MIYYTSDTHFNHANIIRYCNRPFKSVNGMNHEMIKRWNEVVNPEDTVFHLGDFAMGMYSVWPNFCQALNGRKILILGNHDRKREKMLAVGFHEVYDSISHEGWLLVHNPIGLIGKVLCGHVHDKWRRHHDEKRDIINVGVDVHNFYPVTLEQLLKVPYDAQTKDFYSMH